MKSFILKVFQIEPQQSMAQDTQHPLILCRILDSRHLNILTYILNSRLESLPLIVNSGN